MLAKISTRSCNAETAVTMPRTAGAMTHASGPWIIVSMPMLRDLSPFVIAELDARESWKRRDYSAGYTQAAHAAELAWEPATN